MDNYTVGIDFGTLSARASIVDCRNGREIMSKELNYPHAVIENNLPDGTPLKRDWALQTPEDYLLMLTQTLPELVKQSKISPEKIKGICVDFTSSTILPVTKDGTPLCMLDKFRSNPHAYVKLWKHHGAVKEAELINRVASERGEKWFKRYGSRISCEFAYPKMLETLHEAPEVYAAADYFIDAGDWIVWQLCGEQKRSACIAGFKYFYTDGSYPSDEFCAALHPDFANVADKLSAPVVSPEKAAGRLTQKMADATGLCRGIAVASAVIDAHAAAPVLKITKPGRIFAVLGTSACFVTMDRQMIDVPGIFGAAYGATMDGYVSYEAGLSGYGDCFMWVAENLFPQPYVMEAKERGIDAHRLLTEKAAKLKPGETGLIALDWFNGNRSVLNDSQLSGMILGLTLSTKPEEIYRAVLEATSFGMRVITDNFIQHGIAIDALYVSGGIAAKNDFLVQMLSDILHLPIYLSDTSQCGAVGSAIYAAAAAGVYDSLESAAENMGSIKPHHFEPDPASSAIYDRLYKEYVALHDFFGRGGSDVMHRLKSGISAD